MSNTKKFSATIVITPEPSPVPKSYKDKVRDALKQRVFKILTDPRTEAFPGFGSALIKAMSIIDRH